ncbi:MAG: hypothetical protein KKD90_03255 [Candidatus Omnitrophica bacterium]|nr:hypothetical protein [Candidatus Omnitrophota bacterium]
MSKRYILVCETGWRMTRELSISLSSESMSSVVLIKGAPDKHVRRMITCYKKVRNVFIPPRLFSSYVYVYVFLNLILRRKIFLAIESKDRTFFRFENLKKMLFPGIELTRARA